MKRLRWILGGGCLITLVVAIVVGIFVYRQLTKEPIKLGNTTSELAFMSDRDGSWDIFMLYPDGTLINLTKDSRGDEYLANFTFTGDLLNFYSTDTGALTPGWVNADGTDFAAMNWRKAVPLVIRDGRIDNDPTWSPDGTQLIWARLRLTGVDLYISNAEGTNVRELINQGFTDSAPAWSPDGKRLAFTGEFDGDEQNVYVLDLATEEITQLTDDIWDFQPVWSEDGDRILFIRDLNDNSLLHGEVLLYVMNADGSDLHALGDDEVFRGERTYSPDGQVAFMSNEEGYWHIYLMNADGSDVRRVTDGDANHMFPVWRPIPADEETQAADATDSPTD